MSVDPEHLAVAVGNWTGDATFLDENPRNRELLVDTLPVEATATRWGDEVYADVPIDVPAGRRTRN